MILISLFCLLRKGAYPYEYMRIRKKNFYSHILQEDITDADYTHVKEVCKGFDIKDLEEYHDIYVRSYTLLLAIVFECLKI